MLQMRHHAALAIAVMALAAFNLTFRIGSESLTEWDGSLYATSAMEMLKSGDWVGTTFSGELDYYNSKPPLNVWLIALSLKAFGASLVSVRLASVVAAWLTVLALLVWAWRRLGPAVGILSALVLATCFGFLNVHSGRSANPDALLTLLLLLVVIVLDGTGDRPWRRVWLGPLLAGVFMLKGMAVLLPLLLIGVIEVRRRTEPGARVAPVVATLVIALLPVGAWAAARWQVDQWRFFERLFQQDFVALVTTPLDNHRGTLFFYLNILQKHHYDWIVAAVAVAVLFRPGSWAPFRKSLLFWRQGGDAKALVGWWVAIGFIVPTLMQTKLAWYLNPLYPMFALGVGAALNYGFSRSGLRSRRHLLVAIVVIASVVAESKLIWYSYTVRSLDQTAQGLLLVDAERIKGGRVFRTEWNRADSFVLRAIVGAEPASVATIDAFLAQAGRHEFLVMPPNLDQDRLVRVNARGSYSLYRRRD